MQSPTFHEPGIFCDVFLRGLRYFLIQEIIIYASEFLGGARFPIYSYERNYHLSLHEKVLGRTQMPVILQRRARSWHRLSIYGNLDFNPGSLCGWKLILFLVAPSIFTSGRGIYFLHLFFKIL